VRFLQYERFYNGDGKIVKSLLTLQFFTLPHNFPRRFIFSQPHKLRMSQVTIRGPFGELDLCVSLILSQHTENALKIMGLDGHFMRGMR
jgi:hypothetical protein